MAGETRTAIVNSATLLSEHVREITLRPGDAIDPYFPGQWISLHLPIGPRPPLVRAYSLALPYADDNSLTICFDRVNEGMGSGYLFDVELGTQLDFSGPVGNFRLPETGDVMFVARYTGIVPFRAMLREMSEASDGERRVRLIYGAPSESERIYHPELSALSAAAPWFSYFPVAAGSELDTLVEVVEGWSSYTPMACGVRPFTAAIRQQFVEHLGFGRKDVRIENYS